MRIQSEAEYRRIRDLVEKQLRNDPLKVNPLMIAALTLFEHGRISRR